LATQTIEVSISPAERKEQRTAFDHVLNVIPKGNISDLGAFHVQRKVDVAGYGTWDGSKKLVQHDEKNTL